MRHLMPLEAWACLQPAPAALFASVRMEIESLYAGRPLGVGHIPRCEYPGLRSDPAAFAPAVGRAAGADQHRPVICRCRSRARTLEAGQVLERGGFGDVCNLLHGFGGQFDDGFRRSTLNGWRFDGLPWEQT